MNDSKKFIRNEKIIWRYVKDAYYLLDSRTSVFCRLNETASFLWHVLETEHTEAELLACVSEISGKPEDFIKIQIRDFIKKMCDDGFLKQSN